MAKVKGLAGGGGKYLQLKTWVQGLLVYLIAFGGIAKKFAKKSQDSPRKWSANYN